LSLRLFTGIDLPEDVHEKLERLLAHLRPTAHLIWSPIYNLHITTKFIGSWPEEELGKLTSALQEVPRSSSIAISIRGVGWYPNPHNPRVFWVGVVGGAPLAELAKTTEDALDPLGVPREQRAFSPHLTLARIRRPVPLQAMRQTIARIESLEFGSFEADRFHLYLSRPGPAGSVYSKLVEFPFTTR
jgi:RNA 2',3'-cyclic 3'-phosphodiesterase